MSGTPASAAGYPKAGSGREVGREQIDEATNGGFDFLQRTTSERSVPERYLDGELAVHVHLGLRAEGGEGDTYEVCAIYEVAVPGVAGSSERACVPVGRELDSRLPRIESHDADGRVQALVFVGSDEPVDDPERVIIGVRSVVRLRPLDECDVMRLHSGELASGAPREAGGRRGEGKLVSARPSGLCSGEQHELVHEMVEHGTKAVREVADDGAEARRWLPVDLGPEDVLVGLTVVLADDFDGFRAEEGCGFGVQQFQMFACPVELGSDPGE